MRVEPKNINVLIACEESQAEMMAFRSRGFNVYSCDLQLARFDPSRHILGDVLPLLYGKTDFVTQDGKRHSVGHWHLIIAHPPCTYLCKVGSVWLYKEPNLILDHGEKRYHINENRYRKLQSARRFFYYCLNAVADYVAVENPLPMALAELPKPDCFADPSWFGVKYTKKTCYWLRNLPPLMAEIVFPGAKSYVRASRGKYRSRTFPQLANAIAKQWGDYILDDMAERTL